jgi:hypothetical protein
MGRVPALTKYMIPPIVSFNPFPLVWYQRVKQL